MIYFFDKATPDKNLDLDWDSLDDSVNKLGK